MTFISYTNVLKPFSLTGHPIISEESSYITHKHNINLNTHQSSLLMYISAHSHDPLQQVSAPPVPLDFEGVQTCRAVPGAS